MKYSKLIILGGFIILLLQSCTKNFEEINTNPTLITRELIKPSLLFTPVVKNSVFGLVNRGPIAEYSGYVKNPASGNIFLKRAWDDPYSTFYRDYIVNISQMMRITSTKPILNNQYQIARIWKVWLYHILTDAYGDIPYSEAAKNYIDIVFQPRYDSQESIYKDLLKELKEAVASLSDDGSQVSLGNADILLNGNIGAWRRFGNSLRLRLAMRIRFADAALAQQNISELLSSSLIDDNSQNVFLSTLSDGNNNNANPFYIPNLTQPGNMLSSFTVTDNLKRLSDPRLPIFARPSSIPVAGYRGVPIQLTQLEGARYGNDSASLLGDYFLQRVLKIYVINAAEVKFLRAEAALAGITNENAGTLFIQGIQLSLNQFEVSPALANTYIATAGTLTGTPEQKLEQIIVQKWIANFPNSYEGWAEYRRTGYPRIWTGGNLGDTRGNIPRRIMYSGDEYLKNAENVRAAAALLSNGDDYMSKIWWDKKPGLPVYHPRQGMFPPEMY